MEIEEIEDIVIDEEIELEDIEMDVIREGTIGQIYKGPDEPTAPNILIWIDTFIDNQFITADDMKFITANNENFIVKES